MIEKQQQEREPEQQPQPQSNTDRPQEIIKQPLQPLHGINRYLKPTEKTEQNQFIQKQPESDQEQQKASAQTFTITHYIPEDKHFDRYRKAMKRYKPDQEHKRNR